MQITSITRKISGDNYDNISATATIDEGENIIEAAKLLDAELQKALEAIHQQDIRTAEIQREKREAVSFLKRALDYAENNDIPF